MQRQDINKSNNLKKVLTISINFFSIKRGQFMVFKYKHWILMII